MLNISIAQSSVPFNISNANYTITINANVSRTMYFISITLSNTYNFLVHVNKHAFCIFIKIII